MIGMSASYIAATKAGKVGGAEIADGVVAWSGIPYAAAPLGDGTAAWVAVGPCCARTVSERASVSDPASPEEISQLNERFVMMSSAQCDPDVP